MMSETVYQSEAMSSKKRKIDWNGVIIKELRKVFKTAHMKPLKKMSTNGKEENAPWREWFAAASDRGVETQLPPDILKKARERYPLPPQNGPRSQYIDPAVLEEINGTQNYSDILREMIPNSQSQDALHYLRTPSVSPVPSLSPLPSASPVPSNATVPSLSPIPNVSHYYDLTVPPSSIQHYQHDTNMNYHPYAPRYAHYPNSNSNSHYQSSEPVMPPPADINPPSHFHFQPPFPTIQPSFVPSAPFSSSLAHQLSNFTIQSSSPENASRFALSPMSPPSPASPISPMSPISPLPAPSPPSLPSSPPSSASPPQTSHDYLQNSQAEECTEDTTPPGQRLFRHSDSLTEFLEKVSKKEQPPLPLPILVPPPLSDIPTDHQTSNPLLSTFFAVPTSSPRISTSPTIPPRMPHNTETDPPVFIFQEPAPLPPQLTPRSRSSSLPKEEPLISEFARPQKQELSSSSNSVATSSVMSISATTNLLQPKEASPPVVLPDNIVATKVEADSIHSKSVFATSVTYTHAHQLSDIRLKNDVTPIAGGMEVIRNLHPVSYNWKPGALEMALTMKPESTKNITKANTKANTNIQPQTEDFNHTNGNSKTNTKHVNYSEPATPPHYLPSRMPPSMVRATSVPASIHSAPPHHPPPPLRASSELHLFHQNYHYYIDQEDKYDSDYTDDSDDFSDVEDDGDYDDDGDESMNDGPKKTVGFIAQDVRSACPNLVNENPQTSILTIDTVGMLACVVDAVKDLDIRMRDVAANVSMTNLSPLVGAVPKKPVLPQGSVISLCSIEQGNLVLNPKALDHIKSLSSVSVLSVSGPRRTAKSFFCNMFLPKDATSKFATIKSTSDITKGIWFYTSPISDSKGEKNYLIVDSEGIDYLDTPHNASKLVAFLWLISSVVVYKEYRNLDIIKFDIFRAVRNHIQKIKSEHEPPALAAVIDNYLRINEDQYINSFVCDSQHPLIGEAVRKCFTYRTIMQLAVPQFDTKDYHSGQFYNSFISIREKLETLLLNFKLGGGQDATGAQFATYLADCVNKLNAC